MLLYSIKKSFRGVWGLHPHKLKNFAIVMPQNGLLMLKTSTMRKLTMPIYTANFPQDF